MALTSVLRYYMTSFNYDDKKAKDVGITCRCYLSNILTVSVFYDSMGWEINCFLFVCFVRVITTAFLFYARNVAGLVNTIYLTGCLNKISIKPWIKVMQYSLLWLACHIRTGDQYLPYIHSWDSGPWKVLYVPLFLIFFFW